MDGISVRTSPRRARATYGSLAKRRRDAMALQSAKEEARRHDGGDSQGKVLGESSTPPKKRPSGSKRARSSTSLDPCDDPDPASSRLETSISRPSRPSTPSPPPSLSQEVAKAFETASPGSSRTIREARDLNGNLYSTPGSPHEGRGAHSLSPKAAMLSSTSRRGRAAQMSKAKRVNTGSTSIHGNSTTAMSDNDQLRRQRSISRSPCPTEHGQIRYSPVSHELDGTQAPHNHLLGSPSSKSVANFHSPLPKVLLQAQAQDSQPSVSTSTNHIGLEYSRCGPDHTYSNGSRTFLQDRPERSQSRQPDNIAAREELQTGGDLMSRQEHRESYVELRKRWVIEDEGKSTTAVPMESLALPLRSLTALRSDGSQKRFLDGLDYLLAGLDPSNPLSARRSSSVELLKKMCNLPAEQRLEPEDDLQDSPSEAGPDEFLLHLRLTESQGRIWRVLRRAGGGTGTDQVIDWALVIALARMSEQPGAAPGLFKHDLSDIIIALRAVFAAAQSRQGKGGSKKKAARNEMIMLDTLRSLSSTLDQAVAHPFGHGDTDSALLVLVLDVITACCTSSTSLLNLLISGGGGQGGADHTTANVSGSEQPLLCLLFRQMSLEARTAAACVQNYTSGNCLLPSEGSSTNTPSISFLSIFAKLLERCTGPADAIALSSAVQELKTVDETMLLASDFVSIAHFLILLAHPITPSGSVESQDLSPAQRQAAMTTLADWLKLLAAFTQHNSQWCTGVLASIGGLEAFLRLLLTLGERSQQLRTTSAQSCRAGGKRSPSSGAPDTELLDDALSQKFSTADGVDVDAVDIPDTVSHDIFCYCLALIDHLVTDDSAAKKMAEILIDPRCRRRGCVTSACNHQGATTPALVLLFNIFLSHYRRSGATGSDDVYNVGGRKVVEDDVLQADSALLAGCLAHTIGLCIEALPSSLDLLKGSSEDPAKELGDCLMAFSAVSRTFKSRLESVLMATYQAEHGMPGGEGQGDEDVDRLARFLSDGISR